MAGQIMLKELQDINLSEVEALASIKAEDDVVRGLIDKANASREKVAAVVYERVMADYDARLKALDAQARPLRRTARDELAKLKALHARLASGLESAKLDLSELEFRHEIGEIEEAVFQERRTVAQEALSAAESNFDEAEKIAQRFHDVLPAEPDPEPEPPPAPPPTPPPAAPPEPVSTTSLPLPESSTLVGRVVPAPGTEPEFATMAVSREEAMALSAAAEAQGGTMIMSGARLVGEVDGAEGPVYVLGALTTIGRTPDNSIALDKPEVSRRHARISLGEDGAYTLVDNKSNNGSYVNGERVSEHRLREGDRVQVGTHVFVFHER